MTDPTDLVPAPYECPAVVPLWFPRKGERVYVELPCTATRPEHGIHFHRDPVAGTIVVREARGTLAVTPEGWIADV